ncbi:MAG: CHRD domain-containing protein, partial [Pseudomonadota bacterium]
ARQTDLEGMDAIAALSEFTSENFEFVGDGTAIGTAGDDTLVGTDGDDEIDALAGDDVIDSLDGSDDITTGEGSDVLVYAGDPFEGADVSAAGRQVVGGEDFIRDFSFGTAVTSIVVNSGATSQAVVDAADAGNIYFNIHSTNFPAGEVRGNLALVEDNRDAGGIGSVTFNAVLNGANEVQDPPVDTDAAGTGTVTFTVAADGSVTYTTSIEIENFDVSTLTVGHFHEAPAGSNGPVVVNILGDARADGSIEGSLVDGDLYQIDAGDYGVDGDVSFVAVDLNEAGAEIPAGSNVIVVLNTDNDDNPDTPFNAGAAASQIAALVEEPGPGFFVYWNSNLGVNRLVYSSDLSSADADLKIVARQTDLEGMDAIAALSEFTSENFEFVGDGTAIGTAGDDTLVGTDGDDEIDALAGDDVIDSLDGSDDITTGEGSDVLVYAGDPFEGADVSAAGRQVVGGEDFIRDFSFGTAVTSIVVNSGATSQAVVDAADAGNIYFNIHSTNFPAGEVRGNLALVEDNRDAGGIGSVTFNAVLNGANEVQDPPVDTDAAGTGTVTFTVAADGSVTYTTSIEIENFDVSTLTVGHFHEAPAGSNGPVVVNILGDARADGSIEGSLVDGDLYQIDAGDYGVDGDVSFVAVDLNEAGAEIPAGSNVIVVLNTDNDDNPDTPFNAGAAASQIAALVEEPGPGFFVYWNSNLGVNRLVYSSDLSSADADLKIVARQTDLEGMDAIAALSEFTSENFEFVDSGTATVALSSSEEVSLLELANELEPITVDVATTDGAATGSGYGQPASGPSVSVQPNAAADSLFADPIDDDALAALAQAEADAAAGGL